MPDRNALLFLLLLGGAGCSRLPSWIPFVHREATPEAKRAVLNVTNEYLVSIVRANTHKIDESLVWTLYLAEKGEGVTKADIYKQVAEVKAAHPSDHPIANLDVVRIDVRGDVADVVLKRKDAPTSPEFSVTLNWVGRGWMIVGDTLLGPDGALHKMG
jgi:hypothetical protein